MPVPEPQGPGLGDLVQPDTVHAHVLYHARVPRGRRPSVAQGNIPADIAAIRLKRDNYRLGTGVRVAVHAGRGQHTFGGPDNGAADKRDASKCEFNYYNMYAPPLPPGNNFSTPTPFADFFLGRSVLKLGKHILGV